LSKIESKIGVVKHNDKKVYSFITDFSNLSNFIPADKVSDWKADADSCSFGIAGLGRAGLRIIEKEPHKLVKVVSDETTPLRFTMWIQLKSKGEDETRVKITAEPEVNSLMLMMVKEPLKQFLDKLVSEMENFRF